MKRCPECRRDYYDDSLLYCLDDGNALGRQGEDGPTILFRPQAEPARPRVGRRDEAERSIAVLPFSNVSADPENEFFCDGLAEELLSSLARIDGLIVASRTSAFSFKAKDVTVNEIAAALGVAFVLEGSVRRSGNRLRISVQLINAAIDRPVWSERYDREMNDIFDVQDDIALAVVNALKVKLFGGQKAALLKRYTDNPEAYELFLKGRFHWYKHTPDDVRKSLEYFLKAIELDPNYAPGHAGLSEFYGVSSALGMMDPAEGWPLAENALTRARELDAGLPEVHNGSAAVRGFFYRDYKGAEEELWQAMELNTRFAEAHSLYSFILAGQGRIDEAIAEATAALELDPLSLIYGRYLALWLCFARRFDEAIERYRQLIKMHPNAFGSHIDLRNALEHTGRKAEAVGAWRQEALLRADIELIGALDPASGPDAALKQAARLDLDRLEQRRSAGEWVAPIEFAGCYLRLDDRKNALAWLEKAGDVRDGFALLIPFNPFLDSLRNDPGFDKIVLRIKGTV